VWDGMGFLYYGRTVALAHQTRVAVCHLSRSLKWRKVGDILNKSGCGTADVLSMNDTHT
jgi:hypothetical protein